MNAPYAKRKERFEEFIRAFEEALAAGREQILHSFLTRNPWLLRLDTYDGLVLSKFRLADKYVTDFVVIGTQRMSRDIRPVVTFIEIEPASKRLYTRNDDPTSFLTHAIQQVQDWKTWVEENRAYLRGELLRIVNKHTLQHPRSDLCHWQRYVRENPRDGLYHGFIDRYLVVAGRRTLMNVKQRIKLSSITDNLHKTRVITYDCIIEDLLRGFDIQNRGWDHYNPNARRHQYFQYHYPVPVLLDDELRWGTSTG